MGTRHNEERSRTLLAVGLALGLCAILWSRTSKLAPGSPAFSHPGDHHMYIYMAEHGIFTFRIAPFSWRPLVPAIAALFPGAGTGFAFLAIAGLGTAGAALYRVARRIHLSHALGLLGVLLFFSLTRATKFNLYDYWLTDAVAFGFAAAAMLALLSKRDVLFAVLLAFGVLAKETVILVAPLAYSLRAAKAWDPAAAKRALLLVAPALVALVSVRLGIPPANGDAAYIRTLPPPIVAQAEAKALSSYGSFVELLRGTLQYRSNHVWETVTETALTFGLVVPALVVVGLKRSWRLAIRLSPVIVGSIAQLLIARNTNRLVVAAFPAVLLLALLGARQLVTLGISSNHLLLAGAALFGATLIDPNERGMPTRAEIVILGAGICLFGLARLARRPGRQLGTRAGLSGHGPVEVQGPRQE